MAHKKGVGSTDNGRDSKSKRLGVKLFGGQFAKAGNILVRQRGTKFHAGDNVYMGKDFTLHAAVDGTVSFRRKKSNRTYISIEPAGETVVAAPAPAKAKAAPKAAKAKPAPKAATAPVTDENGGLAKPLGAIDDLKLIKGVGAVLERRLNDAGIYHFWQIAKLRKAQMESLEGILRFPGRMTRDNWKAQARALAKTVTG